MVPLEQQTMDKMTISHTIDSVPASDRRLLTMNCYDLNYVEFRESILSIFSG